MRLQDMESQHTSNSHALTMQEDNHRQALEQCRAEYESKLSTAQRELEDVRSR